MKLTVLVENTVRKPGLLAEHGLAFRLETGSRGILFDTGQSDIIAHNAAALGLSLRDVNAILLSHGHFDHTGGLGTVLRDAPGARVFLHPAALEAKYSGSKGPDCRFIGMAPETVRTVRSQSEVHYTSAPTEIAGGLFVTGPVPRGSSFENTGGAFFRDPECGEADELPDDQAAFMETRAGLVVILGCAHAGVVNTLTYIRDLVPGRPVHAVIGGMHLGAAGPERIAATLAVFRELDPRWILPLHCTGFEAAARMWNDFPERVLPCPVGTEMDFE